ncbi:carbohydrate ABC transporter permease [Planctomonas psychrotolerans]|uniref:carbohydrate ABC transporter permease n=1 Tax=Planctomonas psychrotolerans TaxID=2528712 RepID=UPI001238BFDC|nr:carbohydrate ABC transporter permease [Planctomonas psychrotolerans]
MSSVTVGHSLSTVSTTNRARKPDPASRGQWWRFGLILTITAIVLVPIASVVLLSLQPSLGSTTTADWTIENYATVFERTNVARWMANSLSVTLVTVLISVIVAAPAGYVLSRSRSKLVSGYSLVLFVVQSLPIVTAIIPLFILFAQLQLVDSLVGITIIYVGSTMSVAIWMMAAYYDSIPITLEEAAWMDGCSVFGSFTRVVLRNSLPGVLSTAIFSFLLAWNDYLVAVVFLRSNDNFTLQIGLQSFFQQNATNWGLVMTVAVLMMLPPVILFIFLNKHFSVGGIGGSLAGR